MTNAAEFRSSTLRYGGLLALLVTLLAACGPSGGTEPPPSGDTSVHVTVTGPGRLVQGDFTCSGSCTWTGDGSEPATLQALPSTGNVLVAWGGVCPVLAEECTRTFTDGDDVTVTFAPHAVRLDLTGDGEGLFRVAGGPVNETCDGDCGVAVDTPLQLAITYEAAGTRGTTLGDWTGACAAAPLSDYCLVTASGATNTGKTWRHPPVATSDGYTTWRNAPLSVDAADGVLANDTDTEGDPLTVTVAQDVTNGTLTLRPDGGFDYEPTDGFEGQEGFTYVVQDAFGNEATANVTIAVVDRVPAAADDAYATTRNAELVVDAANGVLVNDVDPDGDALSAVLVDDVTGGTLTLAGDGSFSYAPNPAFVGTDSFTYRASDGVTTGNLATVTITVANGVPASVVDLYDTLRNTTLTVAPVDGVLANDSDPDDDPLTATLVEDVTSGTLTLALDGSFEYVPAVDFVGTDTFTYVADDGVDTSPTTTVTVEVTNEAPEATADSYGVIHDTTLTVAPAEGVLANDSDPDDDPLTATLVEDVTSGTLTLALDGSFEYVPAVDFVGTDTFTYVADDGVDTSPTTTVTIEVTNTAPTAVDDDYATDRATTLVVDDVANGVLANDTDAEGDALLAVLASDVSDGTLTLDGDGSFEYVPDPDFVGTDSFTYQADDGVARSETATVMITVDNGAPVAAADAYRVVHDTTLTVPAPGVLGNDDDPNGDPLTAVLVGDVGDGSLALDSDGSFAYVPDADFVGIDAFTYQASDGVATSATTTVTITVTNQAPTASADSYDVLHDTTLTVAAPGVLSNDGDPDGDPITALLVSDVSDGALTLSGDGSFQYVPDAAFAGTDTFTYQASDGLLTSAITTVTITVTNEPPEATADSYDVLHDTTLTVAAPGVLSNDGDPDDDPITAELVAGPTDGALSLAADGGFSYTPGSGFTGDDAFTYEATDGVANSATVTVTITVTNEAPEATADSYGAVQGVELSVSAEDGVLANDSDPDEDTLLASLVDTVSNGDLTLGADGSFTYTSEALYTGTDSFTYQATDGLEDSAMTTVTIDVQLAP